MQSFMLNIAAGRGCQRLKAGLLIGIVEDAISSRVCLYYPCVQNAGFDVNIVLNLRDTLSLQTAVEKKFHCCNLTLKGTRMLTPQIGHIIYIQLSILHARVEYTVLVWCC